MKKGKIFECPKNILIEYVKSSITYSEILIKLGLRPIGNNRYNLKIKIKEENIDDSHLSSQTGFNWAYGKCRVSCDDAKKYFVENSTADRATIKKYILRFALISYVCKHCNQGPVFNNKPLTLDLDHINGIRNDNRLNNLRFLCPNCHSQETTTNRRSGIKVLTEDMINSIITSCKSKREIFQKLNLAESGANYKHLNKFLLKNKIIFNKY